MSKSLRKRIIKLEQKRSQRDRLILVAMFSIGMPSDHTIDPQWRSNDEQVAFVKDYHRQRPNSRIAKVNSAIITHWRETGEVAYEPPRISLDELNKLELELIAVRNKRIEEVLNGSA